MKKTISLSDFRSEWNNTSRANSFSYRGLEALYGFLIDLEDNEEIETELDIIAVDCEFVEYESFKELQEDYDVDSIEELEDNTIVIRVGSEGLIIQAY